MIFKKIGDLVCGCGQACYFQGDIGDGVQEWKCSTCMSVYQIIEPKKAAKETLLKCIYCQSNDMRVWLSIDKLRFDCTYCLGHSSVRIKSYGSYVEALATRG